MSCSSSERHRDIQLLCVRDALLHVLLYNLVKTLSVSPKKLSTMKVFVWS